MKNERIDLMEAEKARGRRERKRREEKKTTTKHMQFTITTLKIPEQHILGHILISVAAG